MSKSPREPGALRPITGIAIAGLGRCGTTAIMSMLDAGGCPVLGTAPDYESGEYEHQRHAPGLAYKLLDPHNVRGLLASPAPPVVLWLARSYPEQARSTVRFQALALGVRQTRQQRRALPGLLKRQTREALAVLLQWSTVYRLTFEDLLADPVAAAAFLADLVERAGLGTLDQDRAVGAVHNRGPAARSVPYEAPWVAGGKR